MMNWGIREKESVAPRHLLAISPDTAGRFIKGQAEELETYRLTLTAAKLSSIDLSRRGTI
jgi:hypothetical protein